MPFLNTHVLRIRHVNLDRTMKTVYSTGQLILLKGIGPQTIVCAFYESLHVAEQFATNFMKINQGIRKLQRLTISMAQIQNEAVSV